MPPKGKKAAPAPFPQGKAGGSKKAPKVRIPKPTLPLSQALTMPEPSHREAPQELRYRSGHPAPAQCRPHGPMARIRSSSAPEEDPQHALEGTTGDCPVPARCRPQLYVAQTYH
jgi:hypothetical protein